MLSEDLAHRDTFLKLFPSMQYAPSREFFPYPLSELISLGIVNVLTIDLHIRFSFGDLDRRLTGACVRLFNKDHEFTREGNLYALQHDGQRFPHFTQEVLFSLDPAGTWRALFIQTLAGFPFISFLIFNILLLFLPTQVSEFFGWINIIALIIVGCYLAYKVLSFLVRIALSSRGEIGGIQFSVRESTDQLLITPELTQRLFALTQIGVSHIAFQGDMIFIRQDPIYAQKSIWRGLMGLVWKNHRLGKPDFVSLQQGVELLRQL